MRGRCFGLTFLSKVGNAEPIVSALYSHLSLASAHKDHSEDRHLNKHLYTSHTSPAKCLPNFATSGFIMILVYLKLNRRRKTKAGGFWKRLFAMEDYEGCHRLCCLTSDRWWKLKEANVVLLNIKQDRKNTQVQPGLYIIAGNSGNSRFTSQFMDGCVLMHDVGDVCWQVS